MKEIRNSQIQSNSDLELIGTPIVYDEPTIINDPLGNYTEIIKRGALDTADLSDIRLLYNHDTSKIPLARVPKTMGFNVDDKGLHMRATLPNTEEAKAVHTAVCRGDLTGMSFAFKVPKDGSFYDSKTNTRTITKIEKVYECSVVPYPAYQNTSIEARNQITEVQKLESQKDQAKIKINQILKGSI
ncbi:HK97 family phage prohead protease [Clostridium botulinum]|uniref:Phage prohead protease, HK97 family n=2 Tax=Clostridiaceae TaxID=31979 RepID=B2THE1_CLOBB|nr:phage prohead protease, HK97 family [Clostridium botulinum B str. Eklund 17B (NRP)]MBY6977424.1 HK97 family phage prohead protease [Clostridium botulinum]MBY7001979.1 HK97 family phage prohead protease [Clostridium botulinum]MCS6131415.1 HK97 family phage prohead protease [Clostridium botulinum]NFD71022.1 HK97 family phage prohead protease [Clostridium botulinum]